MQFKSLTLAAFFILATTLSYGQVVASINSLNDYSQYNTMVINSLSYQVIDAETNIQFNSIDYSASEQSLKIDAVESVQFISILKDGEDYLINMPVFSKNINLSMGNYEPGQYELILRVEGNVVPTVIEITKE